MFERDLRPVVRKVAMYSKVIFCWLDPEHHITECEDALDRCRHDWTVILQRNTGDGTVPAGAFVVPLSEVRMNHCD